MEVPEAQYNNVDLINNSRSLSRDLPSWIIVVCIFSDRPEVKFNNRSAFSLAWPFISQMYHHFHNLSFPEDLDFSLKAFLTNDRTTISSFSRFYRGRSLMHLACFDLYNTNNISNKGITTKCTH